MTRRDLAQSLLTEVNSKLRATNSCCKLPTSMEPVHAMVLGGAVGCRCQNDIIGTREMPARKKFSSTKNESAVRGGAAAIVDFDGGGVDAEGFCEIKRAVRLVSYSYEFVMKERGAIKWIMRRGIGNCSGTTRENVNDGAFETAAGGLLVHGMRSCR